MKQTLSEDPHVPIASRLAAATAALALTASLGAAAFAQDNTPLKSDQDFVNTAIAGGIAEVRESRLALERSQNPAIRAFAQKMIEDHSAANTKLAAVAKQEKLTYPTDVTADESSEYRTLTALSGRDFDRAYVADQLAAHQATVALLQAEMGNSSDQQLKTARR